jgi:hypothetical protein
MLRSSYVAAQLAASQEGLSSVLLLLLLLLLLYYSKGNKCKVIPVTGRESPWGCETSKLPHFLDSRVTDGGKLVSLMRRPPFTPRKIAGTHFC